MGQNDLISLGKKIAMIMKEGTGKKVIISQPDDNNPNAVIIYTSCQGHVKKIKRLVEKLNLPWGDYSKKGYSGSIFSILIELDKITEESILLIEEEIADMIKGNSPYLSQPEPVFTQVLSKIREPKNEGLLDILKFLRRVLKYEGYTMRDFKYINESEFDFKIILCRNTEVSKIIHLAVIWYTGDQKSVTKNDGYCLSINLTQKVLRQRVSGKFCPPPSKGENAEEVERRLLRVSPESEPKVSAISRDSFSARYTDTKVQHEIYESLISMGWTIERGEENTLTIYTAISRDADNQAESSYLFKGEEKEAVEELSRIHKDKNLFSHLSPETQYEIEIALNEYYVRSLLLAVKKK